MGSAIVVPPSELDNHLGRLLETGVATDITIRIGRLRQFKANRCVLPPHRQLAPVAGCGWIPNPGARRGIATAVVVVAVPPPRSAVT